ncbi:hypothetical protein MW887_009213 [Aspergillus wentii]|nr:hypothetical protein MW887_009213 [Aspergillus wentii]
MAGMYSVLLSWFTLQINANIRFPPLNRLGKDHIYAENQLVSPFSEKCALCAEPGPRRAFGSLRKQHRHPRFD